MNWFRIRANGSIEDERTYWELMHTYAKHVHSIKEHVPDDLLQYFGTDFFHDGSIESVHFESNHTDVTMTIWGPNIKRWNDQQQYEYLSIAFRVMFTNVVVFDMHIEKYDAHNDPLHYGPRSIQYLYGEIDSVSEDITLYDRMYESDDLRFHSLVFQTVPCERWYKLIFSDVSVRAKEPVAFALMRRDTRYEIPTYDVISNQKPVHALSDAKIT
jgi:hypothetical protein